MKYGICPPISFVLCTVEQVILDLANTISGRDVLGKAKDAAEALGGVADKLQTVSKYLELYENYRRKATGTMTADEMGEFITNIAPILDKLEKPYALQAMLKTVTVGEIQKNVKKLKAQEFAELAEGLNKLSTGLSAFVNVYDYLRNPDRLAGTMSLSSASLQLVQAMPQGAYLGRYYEEMDNMLQRYGYKTLHMLQTKEGDTAIVAWEFTDSGPASGLMSYAWAVQYWRLRQTNVMKALFNSSMVFGGG